MRQLFLILTATVVSLGGCTAQTTTPTTKAATRTTQFVSAPSLSGRWTGSATVVVVWAQQKQLPVQLDIAPDGSVSGTVGNATLTHATLTPGRGSLQRSLGWGRDYRIHGQLRGDLIKAEGVRRDSVDIVFDRTDERTLTGGLTSSGWEFGGRESMKLAAGNMQLRRAN